MRLAHERVENVTYFTTHQRGRETSLCVGLNSYFRCEPRNTLPPSFLRASSEIRYFFLGKYCAEINFCVSTFCPLKNKGKHRLIHGLNFRLRARPCRLSVRGSCLAEVSICLRTKAKSDSWRSSFVTFTSCSYWAKIKHQNSENSSSSIVRKLHAFSVGNNRHILIFPTNLRSYSKSKNVKFIFFTNLH